ncbi:hypothetical protein [Abyssalbus ytuae]|uniref:DUF3805 domain-containing protein n=1 Tax=Abyssalbus ytuae TaxID=2926907 RepID=A0A9E7D235_9FLAO|nr:hypothetical protein [Abyssalbus ytuae]UOB16284.1 hypothetical protein MQE35_11100 [Abyssalbus ytuae]
MRSYTDEKFGFVFFYPNNWILEKENNIISVYNAENGLGALQFSIFYVGNDNQIDLKVELENFLGDYESVEVEMVNNLAYSTFDNNDRTWKYWLFQNGSSLILTSYNCEIEDKGKEDGVINQILNSFIQSSIS